MKYALALCSIVAALALGISAHAQGPDAPRITFSGRQWRVKAADKEGPGPNHWKTENVSVDKRGWLHVKISHSVDSTGATVWSCAELVTEDILGFGDYTFEVSGLVDKMDPNVVLGLFDYPTPDVGRDGTNEIDIECARWGRAEWPWLNYSVYPSEGKATDDNHKTFAPAIKSTLTWCRFERREDHVGFRSSEGSASKEPFFEWAYSPADHRLVPQAALPVRINLWLFRGHAPADGKDVEIVIRKFSFTPLAEK